MKTSEAFDKWKFEHSAALREVHQLIDNLLFSALCAGAIFGAEEVAKGVDDSTEGGSDE